MKLNETLVSVTIALCLANGHKEWYHQLQIFGSCREKKIIQALHTGKVWKDNMLSIVSRVLNKDSATFLFNAKAKLLLYYFPSHGMGRMKLKQAYGARWLIGKSTSAYFPEYQVIHKKTEDASVRGL